ncbi:MAG: photosystem assembly protein Ycf3 [Chthonomonadales bacterium]|nr:photosystem assembly protein Ycf3 [Chthonomonadales bacterium]
MSQAEVSDSQSGSIEAAVTRLLRWGRIAPAGLARVEYISDTSQAVVLGRLRDQFEEIGVPFVEITLPPRKPAIEQVRFLMEQLSQIETGVVSIGGFARAFPEDTPLVESLRILNFNRENVAHFPLRQIWWMPRDFTQMFRQSVPDLNSWFILKLRLDEITTPQHITSRLENATQTQIMTIEEGVNTSNLYANRFRTALQRQEDLPVLWQLWIDAVNPLFQVGRTNEAVHLQEALLQEASENGLSMSDYLTSEDSDPTLLNMIGRMYDQAQNATNAEFLFIKALNIRRAALPEGHPDIAVSLNNLAELYRTQGRYEEAEPLYQEALKILRTALPAGHPSIANSLNNLAVLYDTQGRYEEAELLYQEALTIDRSAFPAGHIEIAIDLNNLAGLYHIQGRYEKAEPLYQEALTILYGSLPEGHPRIASSLNNLALLYRTQGRYEEAEPLYQEALTIRRDALPEGHPSIANSLYNLAALYDTQCRYEEAEPLFQEALTILNGSLPVGHPNTKSAEANYAYLKDRRKQKE